MNEVLILLTVRKSFALLTFRAPKYYIQYGNLNDPPGTVIFLNGVIDNTILSLGSKWKGG